MIIIEIPLQNVIIDVENELDLGTVSEEEAILHLTQAYDFLPAPLSVTIDDGIATISSPAESRHNRKTTRIQERATSEANRGRYAQAAKLYEQLLQQAPDDVLAHRNLGMALLEMGEVEKAERYLVNALNLQPDDAYALLVLGNIYVQQRERKDIGERLYLRAAEADPEDPYILSNIAALLAERGEVEAAREYFDRGIAAEASYPNAHYGKALSYYREGDLEATTAALEALFAQPESVDIRSEAVYQQAWLLYRQANQELAEENYEASMAAIRAWREELEATGGVEIELVHDPSSKMPAKAEIAWHRPDRTSHVVRYRDDKPSVTPHLIAHELQHIALEQAARDAGRNLFFTTNRETREAAMQSISAEVNQLKRSGALGNQADAYIEQIVGGLANQLFNMPLDFVIEHHLFHEHPAFRPSQFASLYETQKTNRQVLDDSQTKRLAPKLIYNANTSMNAAYALFTDDLFGGATNYAASFEGTRAYRTGRELFALWLETREDFESGDEYALVDEFAEKLRLQRWYAWQEDKELPPEEGGGTTNPELLKEKEAAAVMYCLSALQRFVGMSKEAITAVVGEIALLGQTGLDYASAEKQYTLQSLPGEEFSGLQLMCLMYVGFKDINPALDTGMDLAEPYETALKMYEG